jgi:NADH-quinone oxidoreductase subunit J
MDWLKAHWPDVASLVLIASGVWWMMPRRLRLPKIIGLVMAIAGAGLAASRLSPTPSHSIHTALFFAFSAAAILCAILMITNRNPVYSALWFALTTLSVCGFFLLQRAPFLAAATVTVYAGAIVVTFVFVIMLAQQSGTAYDQRSRQPFLAIVFAILLLAALLNTLKTARSDDFYLAKKLPTAIAAKSLSQAGKNEELDTMLGLGRSLFGDYLFAVELAGTLLLVATIGAIAIAPRRPRGTF